MPLEKSNAQAMLAEKSNAQKDHVTLVFLNMMDSFDIDDLLRSEEEALGKGRFGTTYRADLAHFSLVVKRLSEAYVGNVRYFEGCFQAIGRLKHTNLVSLQGYRISNEEKLLIYNYYPNGSLYSHLHSMCTSLQLFNGKILCIISATVDFNIHAKNLIEMIGFS